MISFKACLAWVAFTVSATMTISDVNDHWLLNTIEVYFASSPPRWCWKMHLNIKPQKSLIRILMYFDCSRKIPCFKPLDMERGKGRITKLVHTMQKYPYWSMGRKTPTGSIVEQYIPYKWHKTVNTGGLLNFWSNWMVCRVAERGREKIKRNVKIRLGIVNIRCALKHGLRIEDSGRLN